jgi:hypothetical protein
MVLFNFADYFLGRISFADGVHHDIGALPRCFKGNSMANPVEAPVIRTTLSFKYLWYWLVGRSLY